MGGWMHPAAALPVRQVVSSTLYSLLENRREWRRGVKLMAWKVHWKVMSKGKDWAKRKLRHCSWQSAGCSLACVGDHNTSLPVLLSGVFQATLASQLTLWVQTGRLCAVLSTAHGVHNACFRNYTSLWGAHNQLVYGFVLHVQIFSWAKEVSYRDLAEEKKENSLILNGNCHPLANDKQYYGLHIGCN